MELLKMSLKSPQNGDQWELESDGDVLLQSKREVREPSKYRVILMNDDYTSFEFVILVLTTIFKENMIEAEAITRAVHEAGRGVCGVYSLEIAETKVAQVHQKAREAGYPLRCDLECE